MAGRIHMTTLYDYNYREQGEVAALANTFANSFPDHEPLKEFVRNLFITRTDESFKLNLKDIAATLDYSGFDPVTTLQTFYEKGQAIKTDEEWPIYNDENNPTDPILIIHSKDINQHIVLHLLFFVLRGTNVEKAIKKIQKQWVAPIKWVFTTYGSFKPAKGKDMDKKTITVSRLAACFPHVISYFLSKGIGKPYIDTTALDMAAGMDTPRSMLTNMFVGLVMKGVVGDVFMPYVKIYHYFLDIVLQRNQATPKSLDKIIKEVELYTQSARSSALYNDDSRKFFTYMLGLTDNTGVPVPLVMRTLEAAKTLWTVVLRSSTTAEANVGFRAVPPITPPVTFKTESRERTVLSYLDSNLYVASIFQLLSTEQLLPKQFYAFIKSHSYMKKALDFLLRAENEEEIIVKVIESDLSSAIIILYMTRLLFDSNTSAVVYNGLIKDRMYMLGLTTELGSPFFESNMSKTTKLYTLEQRRRISSAICGDADFFEPGGVRPKVTFTLAQQVLDTLAKIRANPAYLEAPQVAAAEKSESSQ